MLWVLDKRLIAVAGLAGSLLWGAAANAQTISIALDGAQIGSSFSGGSITGGNASGTVGTFGANVSATGFPGSGFGNPIPILLGNAISVNTSGAGTLTIAITEQGLLTLPSTFGTFSSTYSVQTISGTPLTVTEQTYYDAADGLFTTPTALGTGFTSTAGVSGPNASNNIALSTDFSVTELFTVVATAAGRTNDTINLAVDVTQGGPLGTPLPAALPMLGSVLGCGFFFRRLRNRRKARAQLAAV